MREAERKREGRRKLKRAEGERQNNEKDGNKYSLIGAGETGEEWWLLVVKQDVINFVGCCSSGWSYFVNGKLAFNVFSSIEEEQFEM